VQGRGLDTCEKGEKKGKMISKIVRKREREALWERKSFRIPRKGGFCGEERRVFPKGGKLGSQIRKDPTKLKEKGH